MRRAVADWARGHGEPAEVVDQLARRPPAEAKAWAAERGLGPTTLQLPDGLALASAPATASPAHSNQSGDRTPALPPDVDQRLDEFVRWVRANIAGAGAAGAEAGDIPPGEDRARATTPGSSPLEVPAPAPAGEPWMAPDLLGQVGAAMALQGRTAEDRELLDRPAVSREPLPRGGGVNETMRVDLGDGVWGYHKSFVGIDDRCAESYGQSTRQQPLHEVAAWRLAEALGRPWSEIVPPCVLRTVDGVLGSLSRESPGRPWGPVTTEQGMAAAFYDCLIGQQDRHGGNYLGDETIGWLSLIDHGFAFAEPRNPVNQSIFVVRRVQIGAAALTSQERGALRRLLSSPDLFGLDLMLERGRAAALRERAAGCWPTTPCYHPGRSDRGRD